MRSTNSKLANGTFISPQLIIEQQTIKKLAEQIKAKLQAEQEKKKDEEKAQREAEEKLKRAEEKEKEKLRRAKEKEKEKLKRAKEKEKEKQRRAKEKEKLKRAKEKEKEKQRRAKEKEKQRIAKEKEKEKLKRAKEKEKEKQRRAKEKEKQRIAKEKEKEKLKRAKEKEKEKQRRAKEKGKKAKKKVWKPLSLFTKKGGITARRISANREFFYNKTVDEIEIELQKMGYDTYIRSSSHKNSNAEIIEIRNSNSFRNIAQVQVSLDPNNWHKVPYVKISTNKIGVFKVVNATKKEYNGLKNEKAKIFFKRNKRRKK